MTSPEPTTPWADDAQGETVEEADAVVDPTTFDEHAEGHDESGADGAVAEEPTTDAADELVGQLDEVGMLTAERDEYLDALRRLQAEFDNYRKRVTRQQSELLERASESLLEKLLPTLDALDLAVAHAGQSEDPAGTQAVAALGQIGALLRDTLAKEGLERIDGTDVDFDPTVHDAVAHEPAGEGDDRGVVVVEVLRAGYQLKGRVLRPAMVRVRG